MPDTFGKEVRIILVSPEFSTESILTVKWLNDKDVNTRCVRILAFEIGENLYIEVENVDLNYELDDHKSTRT